MQRRTGLTRSNTRRSAVGVLVCMSVVLAGSGRVEQGLPVRPTSRSPQIEIWAPGIYDGSERPADREDQVRYQVDATVLFPLFSIPLAHREDVGFASAAVQEFSKGPQLVRTFELFSASFPERARGLNRTGFIREVVNIRRGRIRWTAHFGALSSNPETSRQEVALDGDESLQSYTVLDGFTNDSHSSNVDAHVVLDGSWSSAQQFYETLVAVWRLAEPEVEEGRSQLQADVPSMRPLGFLGILHHSLDTAARDVQRRSVPRKILHPFAHKGQLMFLALRDHRVDDKRQQLYVERGLVPSDATVHRLDYQVLDRDKNELQRVRVWTELPAVRTDRVPVSVFPIGFQFKAKSFLELEAVRVEPNPSRYSSIQH